MECRMKEEAVQANVIPIADPDRAGRKVRSTPKGRSVDPQALIEVQALLGDDPRRADLLIEYLHRIQDRYGCICSSHVVALAAEMKLAMTEVYEVATFYHHFDVIKDSEPRPPPLTVRVCESLACEMAGARELMAELAGRVGAAVRIVGAPCVGRCESAPVACVGRNPLERASVQMVTSAIGRNHTSAAEHDYVTFAQYRAAGGYQILGECLSGARDAESVIRAME